MTHGNEAAVERHELPYSAELKRKAVHLLSLVIPLGIWLLGEATSLLILGCLSVAAIAADVLRVRSYGFARFIGQVFGFMMRPEEVPVVGSRIVLNGATWVLISSTLLVALFPLEVAIAVFTAFMIADAAAAVIGRRWGRRRWLGTSRTAEGSAAFLAASVTVLWLFGWMTLPAVAFASLAGAAAEIPSRPLNDNIRVPLVMGAAIMLMRLALT